MKKTTDDTKRELVVNPTHELDLDFVRSHGGIGNSEETLHDKNFITREKAEDCFNLSTKMFLGEYMKDLKSGK